MASDPVLMREVQGWLRKAQQDLRTAEILVAAQPPMLDAAVFHCQQAAEKALKGFLTLRGQVFRKTHSIEEIGEQVLLIDASLLRYVDRAVPLTEYAWRFRYPGMPDEPVAEEADEALSAARELFHEIYERVPESARP